MSVIFHFAASTYDPVDLVDCQRKRGVPSTRDSNTLQERQQLLIAAQRQQQLLIAAVLTSSNQLYLLAVGAVRGVTLPLLYCLFCFAPVKACHRSFFLYYYLCCCCDLCLRSRGCPVASYDSSYTAASEASARCLLQQLRSCLSLTRVTKSYLLVLGTTHISSYFTKH